MRELEYGALSLRMWHGIDDLPSKSPTERMEDSFNAVGMAFDTAFGMVQESIDSIGKIMPSH